MTPSPLARRLGLALCSGYLTWPAALLGERLDAALPLPVVDWPTVFIGTAFGLLVLAPDAAHDERRGLRIAALVASSIAIYTLAIRLATTGYGPLELAGLQAIVASGVLGALLTAGAVVAIAPLRPGWRIAPYALLAGLGGGIAFHYAIGADAGLVVASGYATWQLLVCAALMLGAART